VPMVLSIASPLLWINCITFHVDPNDVSGVHICCIIGFGDDQSLCWSGNRFSSTFPFRQHDAKH
jgi:hypothetical protein